MKKTLFLIPLLSLAMLTGCVKRGGDDRSSYPVPGESTSESQSGGGSGGGGDYTGYYSSISSDLSGTQLLSALNTLNSSKRKKTMGYKGHRNWFKYTERVASTPSNKMVGFYNNELVSAEWDNQATWNHEHIWPNSRGAGDKGSLSSPYIDADIHMVRPCAKSVNSSRGNLMYAESGAYDPGQYVAEYRGVAARIIFYCAIADTRLSLTDNIKDSQSNSTMGKLSDLLKWNLQYAPTTSSNDYACWKIVE